MIHAGQSVVADSKAKKSFLIPVSWEVQDFVRVQADSLEEAVEYLTEHSDEVPLGTEPEYVDGSYKIGSYEECECYLSETITYE